MGSILARLEGISILRKIPSIVLFPAYNMSDKSFEMGSAPKNKKIEKLLNNVLSIVEENGVDTKVLTT